MPKTEPKNLTDYITPLRMNGMKGRMLYLPAPKRKKNPREILIVYGMHASLERMFGFAEELNNYGSVTVPDLPGFGGMDSFYKIGEKPTLDNLADYLASIIQLRFKRKKVTIVGMSYGFLVVTRMLQKYPKLTDKIELLTSLVGFVHHEDFHMAPGDFNGLRMISSVIKHRIPAELFSVLIFNKPILRTTYRILSRKHRKLKDADEEELKKRIEYEVYLWQANDLRTRAYTANEMLKVNLCNQQVKMPVYHVCLKNDHFFDNHVVEQHMRVIFNEFEMIPASIKGSHAPTVVATADEVAPFMPTRIRQILARRK